MWQTPPLQALMSQAPGRVCKCECSFLVTKRANPQTERFSTQPHLMHKDTKIQLLSFGHKWVSGAILTASDDDSFMVFHWSEDLISSPNGLQSTRHFNSCTSSPQIVPWCVLTRLYVIGLWFPHEIWAHPNLEVKFPWFSRAVEDLAQNYLSICTCALDCL